MGTAVSGWADQSTYGRDASQTATITRQPILAPATLGGQPTVQFTTAANSALALGANAFGGQQTTFIVYNDTSTVAYATPIGSVYAGGGGASYHGKNNDTGLFDGTYTHANTLNGNNYQNGLLIGNGTTTPRPDSFTINAYRAAGAFPAGKNINTIGADECCAAPTGTGRSINGGIAEILVYDRQLSGVEIDAVGNYLGSKYGLSWTNISFTQPANSLSVADIVTGGDGTGTPDVNNGIAKNSGNTTTGNTASVIGGTGFQHVTSYDFVDGVNIPDGGASGLTPVTYNSLGGTISGLPDTTNQSWDYVLAEPSSAGFSILDGVDYNNVNGRTMIDIHANTLLTFDLNEIEAFHGEEIESFTGVVGAPNPSAGNSDLRFQVYLDGILADTLDISNAERTEGFDLDIPIAATDQFLTLVALDLGNSISFDQIIIGDPLLNFVDAVVPEPHSADVWLLCLTMLVGWIAVTRSRSARRAAA